MAPTDKEPNPSLFKYFKTIRGPSGSLMTVDFRNGLTDVYRALCPVCLTHKDYSCICGATGTSGKRTAPTDSAKEAKKARNLAALEAAFE